MYSKDEIDAALQLCSLHQLRPKPHTDTIRSQGTPMNDITNPLVISENESIGVIDFWWRDLSDMVWVHHSVNKNPISTWLKGKKRSYRPIKFDKLTNEFKVEGLKYIWEFDLSSHIETEKPNVDDTKLSSETWVSIPFSRYRNKKTSNLVKGQKKIEIHMTTKMYNLLRTWCLVNF